MFISKFSEFKEQVVELQINVLDVVNHESEDGEHIVRYAIIGKDKGFTTRNGDVYSSDIIFHLGDLIRRVRDVDADFDMNCLLDEIKLNLGSQPESIIERVRDTIQRKHLAEYIATVKFTPCVAGEYTKQNGEKAVREYDYINSTIEKIVKR